MQDLKITIIQADLHWENIRYCVGRAGLATAGSCWGRKSRVRGANADPTRRRSALLNTRNSTAIPYKHIATPAELASCQ